MATKFLNKLSLLTTASDPANGAEGDIYYNTNSQVIRYYDGSSWVNINAGNTTYAPLESPTFTGTVTVPTLSLTTSDTSSTASHYMVEVGSDGVVRPKTLANVQSEIVTTSAVNSAAATSLGTVTSGVWEGTSIATTYTDAKVTSVNGSIGAVTGIATDSTVVHLAGTETVTGDKTFSGATSFTGHVSLSDTNEFRIGSSDDTKIWYDGASNKLNIELESTADSISITDNGSEVVSISRSGAIDATDYTKNGSPLSAGVSYQTAEPSSPNVGDLWVDSDGFISQLNQNDFVLKSEAVTYALNPLPHPFLLSGM